MKMSITKKELLELIKDFPDNADVYIKETEESCGQTASYVQHEKRIIANQIENFVIIGG